MAKLIVSFRNFEKALYLKEAKLFIADTSGRRSLRRRLTAGRLL
jgi:hypothetical protein